MNKKFEINAYNPNKNYVIEASAGTGKTFNVIAIVDKLLHNHISLDKILIVTYTEKAAGELRNRIRKNIKDNNLKISDSEIENASIFTIHGFCQSVIKEFGISSNLSSLLEVIDDTAFDQFLEDYTRKGDFLNDYTTMLKQGNKINIDTFSKNIKEAIKKYYLNMNFKEDSNIVSLDNNLEEFFKGYIHFHESKSIEDLFPYFEGLEEHLNDLESYVGETPKDNKPNLLAEELALNYKNGFKFNGKKYVEKTFEKFGGEVFEAFQYFNKLKDLYKIEKSGDNKPLNYLLFKYLPDIYKKWVLYKTDNNKQDFDDMIRNVRESILLKDSELLKCLKKKFKYGIIDEFQDTNQKQFDIFKSIFLEDDDHHLIVVGDPKQSIYSFQGADISVYSQAVQEMASKGAEICLLNKNYRSSKGIVSTCNELFKHFDFAYTEFTPSDWQEKARGDSAEYICEYLNSDIKPFIFITNSDNAKIENESSDGYFAKALVTQIADLCTFDENNKTKLQIFDKNSQKSRNVSFSDFAILLKERKSGQQIKKELKKAGIPFISYKDESLFKGRECKNWIAILDAINSPNFTGINRNLFKKALFTDFFKYSLKDIRSDYFNHDDIDEMYLFDKWRDLLNNEKYDELIDSVIIDSYLMNNLSGSNNIQPLSVYKQLGNYFSNYLNNGHTLIELIRKINSVKSGTTEDDDNDEFGDGESEKSTNFDAIKIMTMHASKGLQFPIVIPVDSLGTSDDKTNKITIIRNDHNKNILTLPYSGKIDTTLEKKIKDNSDAEAKRLIYVAYTRSIYLMLIPYFKTHCNTFLDTAIDKLVDEHPEMVDFKSFDLDEYKNVKAKVSDILAHLSIENNDGSTKEEQNIKIHKLINSSGSKKSYKHSYSSLSHGDEVDYEDNKEGINIEGLSKYDKKVIFNTSNYKVDSNPIEAPNNYPKGASIGTALHEVFEVTDFCNYKDNLSYTIKKCLMKQNIDNNENFIDYTSQIVSAVLDANLPLIHGNKIEGESFKLSSISDDNKKAEMEFNLNLKNEKLVNFCNGFIDLLFKNGDYYSILDWKSDTLNDDFSCYNDPHVLKNHVDSSYSIQRVLYSYCLIKWLKIYYPNLTEEEIFNQHFGGVYYVFIRGCNPDTANGIYAQTWESYQDLKNSFDEIIANKIEGKPYEL